MLELHYALDEPCIVGPQKLFLRCVINKPSDCR